MRLFYCLVLIITKICLTGCKLIVDCGTSNILGPPTLIASINQEIVASRSCLSLWKMPVITFMINALKSGKDWEKEVYTTVFLDDTNNENW
ncbi:hypothetical protein F2Q68_00043687 [Brassica cretica]|uniref:Peptidase A1 domain-containing protein n=1 Tax=Brassica cretica TaxID=69181 RepID=A0A8S9LK42_BRACR|nr:hypothetical protein F2Q68_00043687 [Brassica cretica]